MLLTIVFIHILASMSSAYVLRLNVPEVIVHERHSLYSKNEIQPKENFENILPPDLLEEKNIETEKEKRENGLKPGKRKIQNYKKGGDYERFAEAHLLKNKTKQQRSAFVRRDKSRKKMKTPKNGQKNKKEAGQLGAKVMNSKMFWRSKHEDKELERTRLPLEEKDQSVENRFLLGNALDSFVSGANALTRSGIGKGSDELTKGQKNTSNENNSIMHKHNKDQTGNYLNQKEEENNGLEKPGKSIKFKEGSIVNEDDMKSAARGRANVRKIGKMSSNLEKSSDLKDSEEKNTTIGSSENGKNVTDTNTKVELDHKEDEFNDSSAEKQGGSDDKEEDIDNIETYDSTTEELIPVKNASIKNADTKENGKNGLNKEAKAQNDIQSALTSNEDSKIEKEIFTFSGDNDFDQNEGNTNETGRFKCFQEENVDDNEYVDPTTEEIIDLALFNDTTRKEGKMNNSQQNTGNSLHSSNDSHIEKGDSNLELSKTQVESKTKDASSLQNSSKQQQLVDNDLGEFEPKKNRIGNISKTELKSSTSEGESDSLSDKEGHSPDQYNGKPTPPVILNAEFGQSDEFSGGSSTVEANPHNNVKQIENSEGALPKNLKGKDAENQTGTVGSLSSSTDTDSSLEGNFSTNTGHGSLKMEDGAVRGENETKVQPILGIFHQIDEEKEQLLRRAQSVFDSEFKENEEINSLVAKEESVENNNNELNGFNETDDATRPDISENQNNTDADRAEEGSKEPKQLKVKDEYSTLSFDKGGMRKKAQEQAEAFQVKTDNEKEDTAEQNASEEKLKVKNNARKGLVADGEAKPDASIETGEAPNENDLANQKSTQSNAQAIMKEGTEILPSSEFKDQASDNKTSTQGVYEIAKDVEDSDSTNLAPAMNESRTPASNSNMAGNHIPNREPKKILGKNSKKEKSAVEEMKHTVSTPDDQMSVVNAKINIAQHLYDEKL